MYSGNYRHPYLDYKSRGIFMITLIKRPEIPVLSSLSYDSRFSEPYKMVSAKFTPLGHEIRKSLEEMKIKFPKLGIIQHTIMPDHIHFILEIKETLDEHLGRYLGRFKSMVLEKAKENKLIREDIYSIFERGYNDQYLNQYRSLKILIDYVRENPYRLWVRKNNPDFFLRSDTTILNDEECRGYGNFSLLSNPFKYAVVTHSYYSEEDLERRINIWRYCIANGGVLIGAFVSSKEKEILNEAIALGGKVILFDEIPDKERWKPTGIKFRMCEDGRLLILHPRKMDELIRAEQIKGKKISRERCRFLNAIAERMETGSDGPEGHRQCRT